MKATREALSELHILARYKDFIVLTADLGKPTGVGSFGIEYPNRYFDIGIAENNMISIASGLSMSGHKVFLTSFASFLTGKYDTIRCSLAYPNVPCILVGSHVGMAIGRDGVTQMGLEDVSIMRALPNMVILNPATYIESREIIKYLLNTELTSPHYLRVGRQPVEEVFDEDYVFEFGKGRIIKTGTKGVVFSTGCILSNVLLATEDLDVTVVNIPTIKPLDPMINDYMFGHNNIFTVEDHSIVGGLGSAISEVMAEGNVTFHKKLTRIGLNDEFPESGPVDDLYKKYELDVDGIRNKILDGIK